MSYQVKIHEMVLVFNEVYKIINRGGPFDKGAFLAPVDGILGMMQKTSESNWEVVTRENIKEAESAYFSAFYNDHGNLSTTANLF